MFESYLLKVQSNTLNLMVNVQIFPVCKISGDKQEKILVTISANKELLRLDILRFFCMYSSLKF